MLLLLMMNKVYTYLLATIVYSFGCDASLYVLCELRYIEDLITAFRFFMYVPSI